MVTLSRRQAELHSWSFDGDPPEGFTVETNATGHRYAVRKNDRGEVERNHEGHAVSVPEGGHLIVHPDGRHETIGPRAENAQDVDPSTGAVTNRTVWRDNREGLAEALARSGYDVSELSDDVPED